MSLLWSIVTVTVVVIWVVSIADIVRRRLDAKHTAGWILLVVLLPVLGSLVYWAMRKPTAEELDAAVGARADLSHAPPKPPGGGARIY